MMRCEEFISHISELIEDEIDPALREAMLEHIRQCQNCFVVLDTTRRALRLVGDEDLFELPAEVSERLHRAIDVRLQQEAMGEAGAPAPVVAVDRPRPSRFRLAWSSPRLVWATAALLLLMAGGLQWLNRARTVAVGGWLSDEHCYVAFRSHPQNHPRECMLLPHCKGSGFGVIEKAGNFMPFDKAATPRVVALLEATSSADHIWVNASGHEHAGVLNVTSLELRTPDQRVAWSSPTLPDEARRLGLLLLRTAAR